MKLSLISTALFLMAILVAIVNGADIPDIPENQSTHNCNRRHQYRHEAPQSRPQPQKPSPTPPQSPSRTPTN
uniref:Putative secreted protein n=1 Tax=Triatoma infestans TaxID=30076 RepID=A0A023F086_TRIIF